MDREASRRPAGPELEAGLPGIPALLLWGLVLGCWLALYHGARSRARLLESMCDRYGGIRRRRFSWLTLMHEPAEAVFRPPAAGGRTLRLRYELPGMGKRRPRTVLELEGMQAAGSGSYGPADYAAARTFLLDGRDLTVEYGRLAASLPPSLRPTFMWAPDALQCGFPLLLSITEEAILERWIGFMTDAFPARHPV